MNESMKAIRINQYGGPDVLAVEDAPRPVPAPDEILIRVIATSINPIDCKIRAGRMTKSHPLALPATLGWDASGIVDSVGANVTRFKPGDAVFTYPAFGRFGTYAEFVAVNESEVALKPKTISFVEAAALPMTAQAAWMAVITVGQVSAGQRVLIHGASGGLGSVAVQLAKWRGAHVIGTASGDNLKLLQTLGADEVIDYRTTPFESVVRDADMVLDTVGGQTQEDSWAVLKPDGILVATAIPPSPDRAKAAGVRGTFIFTQPSGDVLAQIAEVVDSGKVRPIIGGEFALNDAFKAHELSESGRARGKIVLYVGQP